METMRLAAAVAFTFLLISACFAYEIKQSREEMLAYYYANIDAKIPKSARALVGDEKVNVIIGKQIIGLETKRGQLSSFELYPVQNPTIIIIVSEGAAEKMSKKQMGILAALDSGGIRIEPKNFFSAIKVEMIKRIYAVSGADEQIFGDKPTQQQAAATANSIYVQRATILG